MFWLSSLKLDAETPELSWGFFGKDGYNATPVKMWAPEQQAQYRRYAVEHDAKWKNFLQSIEAEFANGRIPSTPVLIELFEKRELSEKKTIASQMAGIYNNPKQESKLTGKRSKPKYVAHRPAIVGGDVLIIENRAIRPQQEARQLELMAEYRLRRAEYIKSMLDQGFDVDFKPGQFKGLSKNDTAAQAKVIIEELGLKWSDYAAFGPVANPKMTEKEKTLASHFKPKPYGAAHRDRVLGQVLDSFYAKTAWEEREWRFVLNLTREHGNTVEVLEREMKRLSLRVQAMPRDQIAIDLIEERVRGIARLVDKFRIPSARLYGVMAVPLEPLFDALWAEGKIAALGSWIAHLPDDELAAWGSRAQSLLDGAPNAAAFEIQGKIIQDLEFRKANVDGLVENWFRALAMAPPAMLGSIPESLVEMETRLGKRLPAVRRAALENLVEAEVKFAPGVIREADGPALLLMAETFPKREHEIFEPLRAHLWSELKKTGFGLTDYYASVVMSEKLLAATPLEKKAEFLEELYVRVKAMHAKRNDPDSKSFVERIENDLQGMRPEVCKTYLGANLLQHVRGIVLGGR